MFTPEIIEFFNNRGFPATMGTTDNNLEPAIARPFGVRVAGEDSLSVIIPEAFTTNTLKNIQQNGRIALTQVSPVDHKTFQFKGKYIEHHASTEEEMGFVGENFMAFIEIIQKFYGEQLAEKIKEKQITSFLTFTFKVEQIFNQTPGPGAGAKI